MREKKRWVWNGAALTTVPQVEALLKAEKDGRLSAELSADLDQFLEVTLFGNALSPRLYFPALFSLKASGQLSEKSSSLLVRALLVDVHVWRAWTALSLNTAPFFLSSAALLEELKAHVSGMSLPKAQVQFLVDGIDDFAAYFDRVLKGEYYVNKKRVKVLYFRFWYFLEL
jgi:hypothetical protein